MIKSILVPLDGSKLAECALPYAEEIASKLVVGKVVLVSVTERVKGLRVVGDPGSAGEEALLPEAIGKMERQAARYLNKVAKGLEAKGLTIRKEVLLGNPAQEISIYAESESVDLIVMSSHGRTGPSRWARGSVADKVLKAVRIPVMIIRAPGCSGIL